MVAVAIVRDEQTVGGSPSCLYAPPTAIVPRQPPDVLFSKDKAACMRTDGVVGTLYQ